jgi:hypothetical protein
MPLRSAEAQQLALGYGTFFCAAIACYVRFVCSDFAAARIAVSQTVQASNVTMHFPTGVFPSPRLIVVGCQLSLNRGEALNRMAREITRIFVKVSTWSA